MTRVIQKYIVHSNNKKKRKKKKKCQAKHIKMIIA